MVLSSAVFCTVFLYNFLCLAILFINPVVSHLFLISFLPLTSMVVTGVISLSWLLRNSCNMLKLSLASLSFNSLVQSISFILLLRVSIFLVFSFLVCIFVLGALYGSISSMLSTSGRWSLMSLMQIVGSKDIWNLLPIIMLSMRVELVLVILVGFVKLGSR